MDPSPHSMLKLYLCVLASPKRSPRLAVLVAGEVHGLGWPWQPSAAYRPPMQHCDCKAAGWAGVGASHHPLATPLAHLTSGVPHLRPMGGWAERWHPGAAPFWRQPILPPPAPPAIGRVPSQGQLLVAPGSCGSFTHRMSVLAQHSPSIKTPGVRAVGRTLQLWKCDAAAGSNNSTWPTSNRQRWSCCQRLQVGV